MVCTYREAVLSDLPAVCALGQVVNLLHHEAWPAIFAPPSDPLGDAQHWKQSIVQLNATTFIADDSGQLVAFVTVALAEDSSPLLQPMRYSRIGSVCVGQAHRGRGVGKQLMALAEQWSIGRGAEDIRLNVWSFNETALMFYKELGYHVRSLTLGKQLTQPRPEGVKPPKPADILGIAWCGLYAKDLSTLSKFYEEVVGFNVLERDSRSCIFDVGHDTHFEMWSGGYAATTRKSASEQSVAVGFRVGRLEPLIEQLRKRGLKPDAAIDGYSGSRWIYYTDPEGNRFEFKDDDE